MDHFPPKILAALFSTLIIIIINMFLEHQISMLKWFLMDVTLKTGVMMLKIQFCITGINYILKYKSVILNIYFTILLFWVARRLNRYSISALLSQEVSVWSLHVLFVSACVLLQVLLFPSQSKDMLDRELEKQKLPYEWEYECLGLWCVSPWKDKRNCEWMNITVFYCIFLSNKCGLGEH